MWQFIVGLFIGANLGVLLHAILVAGSRADERD